MCSLKKLVIMLMHLSRPIINVDVLFVAKLELCWLNEDEETVNFSNVNFFLD